MREKLRRLWADPVGVVRRRLGLWRDRLRYRDLRGARAERFWSERHGKYGVDDLRGVGMESWSDAENRRDYAEAGELVLGQARAAGVELARARVLDVGCGVGFYAGLLAEAGVVDYRGVDVSPVQLPTLRARHPSFQFEALDVTRRRPEGEYDLVLMIDVTQHLVDDDDFAGAMRHVAGCVAPGGVLLITSWLKGPERLSYFEVARPRAAYEAGLVGLEVGESVPFRRKHLLTARRALGAR